MSIRPATPDDVPTILALVRELAEYERMPHAVVATEQSLRRDLFGEGFGRGPACEALMGELGGQVQGFALFFMNYSTWVGRAGIYLEDLYVRPSARGKGLGRAMLVELARIARDRGCARMEWSVLDWNTDAGAFYRTLGAKPMDEWTVWRLAGEGIGNLARG